jgi:hypothetical protein
MNRLEGRELEGVLMHGLTHRPGNNVSQMNVGKKSYKRTSKMEANTNPNESTDAKGNYI